MPNQTQQDNANKKTSAVSPIKWVLLIVIGLPIVWFTFCEARKAYWDWRVTQMCENDGGVEVKRIVALSNAQYESLKNKFGEFVIPLKADAQPDRRLVREDISRYLKRRNPEVRRDETRIIDVSGKDVIAVRVIYARVGGDAIALHPSYFSCPSPTPEIFSVAIEGGAKK